VGGLFVSGSGDGQRDHERAAAARCRRDRDVASVQPGAFPGEIESQPRPADMAGLRRHQATEAGEQEMCLLGVDADPVVANQDCRLPLVVIAGDLDLPAAGEYLIALSMRLVSMVVSRRLSATTAISSPGAASAN